MSGQDVVQSLVSFVFTEILRKWVLFLSSLLHKVETVSAQGTMQCSPSETKIYPLF